MCPGGEPYALLDGCAPQRMTYHEGMCIRLLGTFLGVVFLLPLPAAAQSAADLQAQIAQLTQLITFLQSQIGGAQTTGAAPAAPAAEPCIDIPVDLKPNYFDVGGPGPITRLQEFLKETGDFTREPTGYYGPATIAAVQKWQSRHGLVSSGTPETNGYGAVGPRTRAAMRGSACARGVTTGKTTSTTPPRIVITTPTPAPVQPTLAPCFFAGSYVPSGSTVRAYARQTVSSTESCEQHAIIRSCYNGTLSGNTAYAYNSCGVSNAGACILGGFVIAHGESRALYSRPTVTVGESCATYQQVRTCVNGVLTGSPEYVIGGCTTAAPRSCTLDGVTAPHGSSQTFYSQKRAAFGSSCSTLGVLRQCLDGSFAGSATHQYGSCEVATSNSCSLGGVTLTSGESKIFFPAASATSCSGVTRTCRSGVLDGDASYQYASCADSVSACAFDGQTIANGATTSAYLVQRVAANDNCAFYVQTRTCTNGTLSGNVSYAFRTCAPAASGQCVLDNVLLSSGSTTTFYSARTAPTGTLCSANAQSRTCSNGTLSGSATYKYALCTNNTSCFLDGLTVTHGSSQTFYSASSVAYGTTCTSIAQTRTCTNGQLSGTSTYAFGSCRVNPPVSLSSPLSQLAAIAAILESVLTALREGR